MALIRNVAGFANEEPGDYLGAVQALECADPGCTSTGEGGSFRPVDNGPYVYQEIQGSGIYPQVTEYPVDTIEAPVRQDTTAVISDTQPPNVVAVGPATPDIPPGAEPKTDYLGLGILAAMGVLVAKGGKGSTVPLLYAGGVVALYYHLQKK